MKREIVQIDWELCAVSSLPPGLFFSRSCLVLKFREILNWISLKLPIFGDIVIYLLARHNGCFEGNFWLMTGCFFWLVLGFWMGIKSERLIIHLGPSPQGDLTYLWAHKMFYFSVTWNRSEKCTEKRTGMKTLLFLVRWIAELSQEERII